MYEKKNYNLTYGGNTFREDMLLKVMTCFDWNTKKPKEINVHMFLGWWREREEGNVYVCIEGRGRRRRVEEEGEEQGEERRKVKKMKIYLAKAYIINTRAIVYRKRWLKPFAFLQLPTIF